MSDALTAIIVLTVFFGPVFWLCARVFTRWCDEAERQSGGHW